MSYATKAKNGKTKKEVTQSMEASIIEAKQELDTKKPYSITAIAQIPEWIDLPGGGSLHMLPVRQEDQAVMAAKVKMQFEASDEYVERPWYWTVEPNPDENEEGERAWWDARSLKRSGTDEEKEWMKNYITSQQVLAAKTEDAVLFMIFVDGTSEYKTPKGDIVNLVIDEINPEFSPPKGWLLRYEHLHLQVPTNPYELKNEYVSSLLPDRTLVQTAIMRCVELSLKGGLTEEALARFRLQIQREMESNAQRASAILAKITSNPETSPESNWILDAQLQIFGVEGSEDGGIVATESVG